MSHTFYRYLEPRLTPSVLLGSMLNQVQAMYGVRESLDALMGPIRVKDPQTYEHMIRVAWLGGQVAEIQHIEQKVLIYAGLLHDIGKALVPLSTLQKTAGWTEKDSEIMRDHVMDGYRMARDKFNFSAEVILWHHMFQPNSYPRVFPEPLADYSQGTRLMIGYFGRMLALCDCFDAAHRANDRNVGLQFTGEMVKERMLRENPDQVVLIEELYAANVFSTKIYEPEAVAA